MSPMSRLPGRLTVIKDMGTYIGGWYLLFRLSGTLFGPPPQLDLTITALLVTLSAGMIGTPTVMQVLAWRNGTSTRDSGRESSDSARSPGPSPTAELSSEGEV